MTSKEEIEAYLDEFDRYFYQFMAIIEDGLKPISDEALKNYAFKKQELAKESHKKHMKELRSKLSELPIKK